MAMAMRLGGNEKGKEGCKGNGNGNMRVAGKEGQGQQGNGNGDGDKDDGQMECDGNKEVDGNDDKGGGQATATATKRAMVTATRVAGDKKSIVMKRAMPMRVAGEQRR